MLSSDPPATATLTHWIGARALSHGERAAITFVGDEGDSRCWTYGELWRRACCVASRLPRIDQPSPRCLLLFPPGIEFLAGFLGCQIAGWVPVPTCYPRAGREMPRLDSAAKDCAPSAILGDRATLADVAWDKVCPQASSIPRVIAELDGPSDETAWVDPDSLTVDCDDLAMLQYTSGSTSEPRGVMVRHRNLMANLNAIRRGFQIDWQDQPDRPPQCGVFWLPFFHDMGLIGGILEPLFVGGHTVLISPRSFLQRPIRWLQTISDHGAVISGAPNFAYQLAVDRIPPDQTDGLDLSCWQVAFCGAEPIRDRTLKAFATRFAPCRFSPASFYPCYGLAEATLLAAGGEGPRQPTTFTVQRDALRRGLAKEVDDRRAPSGQTLVSSGKAAHRTELLVVDPETREALGDCRVGEIVLRGDGVTDGYWNRDQENRDLFDASLADGRRGFFRSGDLGFLRNGQLYVTGRLKDVIILRGRNHFPQDIEATVRETIGRDGGQCVAIAVEGARSEGLAIIAELPRRSDPSLWPELVRSIRRDVIDVHEVDPRHVLLVRQATVPLTSSGKVQRSVCREMLLSDQIKAKFRYDRSSASEQTPIPIPKLPTSPTPHDRPSMVAVIQSWMTRWLIARAGVQPHDVDLDKPFADYGLDSMTGVEMSGELEDWSGVELTPAVAWNHPTISQLSGFIVDQLVGDSDDQTSSPDLSHGQLAELLDEVE